jgi:hypothetical protein
MGAPLPDALAEDPSGGQQHPVVEQIIQVGDRDVGQLVATKKVRWTLSRPAQTMTPNMAS